MSTINPHVPPWTTEKEKAVYELALKHISLFELYDPAHLIFTRAEGNGFALAYKTANQREEPWATRADLHVASTAHIIWMGIDPKVQRTGYGTLLYRRIEDFFAEAGCEAIELTPLDDGYPFWPKMGFTRHGTNIVPTYRKNLKK